MASLQEVAELCYRQAFPNPGDETSITKEEFIATARNEWAYQTLLMAYNDMQREGYFEPPSYLLSEIDVDVIDNSVDISKLKTFKSLPNDVWLVRIGGEANCDCRYVKTTANLNQLLCDDDSLADSDRTYYVLGKKIKFPRGTHKKTLTLTYANAGENANIAIDIDEAVAAIIRTKLNEIYLGRIPPQDSTNNSNSAT